MEAAAEDRNIRELDPFAFMVGHASAIRPLGGPERGPDPRYVFHTPYIEYRPGRVIYTIRFDKLQASFGELRVFVNAFVPGSGRDAVFVTSSRLDLTDRAAVERGLSISFVGVAGASYAAYGACLEGTDARAAGLTVTAEQIEAIDDPAGEGFLLPTQFAAPPFELSPRLVGDGQPLFCDPVSQLMTDAQLAEPAYQQWLDRLANRPAEETASWRFAFVVQVLDRYGMLRHGARGMALGGGGVVLGPIMARAGCEVRLASLPTDHGASDLAWSDVTCRKLDAAGVPDGVNAPLALAEEPADTRGFDFMWTLGMAQFGYEAGHCANFLLELMSVLRPGGIAVHMLDLAPPEGETGTGLPRSEVERLAVTLISRRFTVAQLNFGEGDLPAARPFGLIVRRD